MDERVAFDSEKGEIRIFGRRLVALDVEALCRDIDSLVGPQVGEVLIKNHERRLGKDDVDKFRKEKPGSSVEDVIGTLRQADALSGVGVTAVTLPNAPGGPALIEISRPCVKETTGSAKSFLFGYWAGVFSSLFGKEYDVGKVLFNRSKDILSAEIIVRP